MENLTRLRLRPTSCRVHEADSVVEMAPVEPIGSIGIDPHIWTAQRSVGPEGPGQPEPPMSVPLSVAEVLTDHVVLEVESIDRMYLNAYVPQLQRELGVVSFFRFHRGYTFASSALMDPISKSFVARVEEFVRKNQLSMVAFQKGQRKDDIAREHLRRFQDEEGVLFVGKAQEKTGVFRTERRRDDAGLPYPWIVRSTAMVNHFYFYCVDRDFGPFFLKFCTYFPYTAKLCLNGHEFVKRQLTRKGIAHEALDNAVVSCEDPKRLQALCDGLSAEKIDALLRKWLRLLPHPFSRKDREAGYRYRLSILQAEFALTQVLDRPLHGRIFFEEVIRENLDLGRPDQVQLIFQRKVTRRTPGRFRTRVLTDGVIPSLYVDYKRSRIKQYHKEGRALRTETTVNDTRDFAIGKSLHNLPALREIGFQANRRLLDVQRISHDCALGDTAFQQLQKPGRARGQRVPALRFGDPRVQALLSTLVVFRLLPDGFSNREMREHLAPLLDLQSPKVTSGRVGYDLRRLRLHGLIQRIPKTHRYRPTPLGFRTALFFTRAYARILRPGLATIAPNAIAYDPRLRAAFEKVETAIDALCAAEKLAS